MSALANHALDINYQIVKRLLSSIFIGTNEPRSRHFVKEHATASRGDDNRSRSSICENKMIKKKKKKTFKTTPGLRDRQRHCQSSDISDNGSGVNDFAETFARSLTQRITRKRIHAAILKSRTFVGLSSFDRLLHSTSIRWFLAYIRVHSSPTHSQERKKKKKMKRTNFATSRARSFFIVTFSESVGMRSDNEVTLVN